MNEILKEKLLADLKHKCQNEADKEIEILIDTNGLGNRRYRDVYEDIVETNIKEYIESRIGIKIKSIQDFEYGINKMLEDRIRLEEIFEKAKNIIGAVKDKSFFERKESVEPILSELHKYIKENYNKSEFNWEYSEYLLILKEMLREGEQYPFIESIEYEESEDKDKKILDSLVRSVREKICRNGQGEYFFYKRCMDCQEMLNNLLLNYPDIMNISIDTQDNFGLPVFQHVFNVVTINNRIFIVDPSYVQFCNMDAPRSVLGIPGLAGGNPGMYMMGDEKSQKLLKEIIGKGYFEIKGDNIKTYLDTFVLANRNFNYYINHTDANTMETEISAEDYMDVLMKNKRIIFGDKDELGEYNPISSDKRARSVTALHGADDNIGNR